MKKVIVLLSIITLVATGCSVKELSRDDFKENIDIVLAGKNNTYNVNFEGYKYYVPAGMSFQNKEEYNAILTQRGNEKLSENVKTETFESKIRQFGDIQYQFGVDYEKGDKITVVDWELGISVSARITNVEEDFSDEYSLVLTFGYSFPTLLRRVKRIIGW